MSSKAEQKRMARAREDRMRTILGFKNTRELRTMERSPQVREELLRRMKINVTRENTAMLTALVVTALETRRAATEARKEADRARREAERIEAAEQAERDRHVTVSGGLHALTARVAAERQARMTAAVRVPPPLRNLPERVGAQGGSHGDPAELRRPRGWE
ncbi:hypothetical protein ACFRJ1_36195 [Streptomyces sp. NPDC056773]|uniref:hypothetical protein n=1 Tax=unclassified Streptomyces TaxID=2593676 RepID=UPI0036BF62EA